jgi:hypothetical protein
MTSPADHNRVPNQPWVEDDDTEAIRPYAVTGGRTSPAHPLDLMSLVRATRAVPDGILDPEHLQVLEVCRLEICTIAEVAALIQRPVQVAKILVSDLIRLGAVVPRLSGPKDRPHSQTLEKLLDGLQNL